MIDLDEYKIEKTNSGSADFMKKFLMGIKDERGGGLHVVESDNGWHYFYDRQGRFYGSMVLSKFGYVALYSAYGDGIKEPWKIKSIDFEDGNPPCLHYTFKDGRGIVIDGRDIEREIREKREKINSLKSLYQMDYNTWINKTRAVKIVAKRGGGVKHEVDINGLCNLACQFWRCSEEEGSSSGYERFLINGNWRTIYKKEIREAVEDLLHPDFFKNGGKVSADNIKAVLRVVRTENVNNGEPI